MAFPIRISVGWGNDISAQFGPWLIGGAWYVLAKEYSSVWSVFKSTDDGATWTLMDDISGTPSDNYATAVTQVGTAISVLSVNLATSKYVITDFDTSTDTWGTTSADGPTALPTGPGSEQNARMVQIGTTYYVFYTVNTGSAYDLRFTTYSSASNTWTAYTVVLSATGVFVQTIWEDGTDLHIAYKTNATGTFSSGALKHAKVSISGTLLGTDTVDSDVTLYQAGTAAVNGDTVYVPYFDASNFAGVWAGTPLSSPVWTWTLVDTVHPGTDGYGDGAPVTAYSFADCGAAVLVWQSSNFSGGGFTINSVYAACNKGSGWSAPTLIYDCAANPPGWITPGDFFSLYNMSANMITGQLRVICTIGTEGTAFIGEASGPDWPDCGGSGYRNKFY